jgi:hypothetical protein
VEGAEGKVFDEQASQAHQDARSYQHRAVQYKAEQQGTLQWHRMPWQWLQRNAKPE